MASVHITHRREATDRSGKEDANKEEEIEVMWPQPQEPRNADTHHDQEEEREGYPLEHSEGHWPSCHLGFRTLASTTIRE